MLCKKLQCSVKKAISIRLKKQIKSLICYDAALSLATLPQQTGYGV
jgi:hypothetical protein